MFDIFFAGSQSPEANEYIISNNLNRLFSYANDRREIGKWVDNAIDKNWQGKLFIDSGAFSAKTRGVVINIDEYIEFVNNISDKIYCFANLDVIHSPGEKTVMDCCREGFKNFMTIMEKSKCPEKCLGVFHRNEPMEVLYWYIDYYKQHPEMKYFALGVGNGDAGIIFDHCAKCCNILKKELPDVKIHLFAYTRMNKLKYINCDSADSATWIMAGANGTIMTDYGPMVVSSHQKNNPNSIYGLHEDAFNATKKYIEQKGFTIEALANDYKQRSIFNIAYMADKAKLIKYQPIMLKRRLI